MEQGYRSGVVCVLMATSTLAAGDQAEVQTTHDVVSSNACVSKIRAHFA